MEIMRIWIDADACPKVIKEILFRAAERTEIPLVLVANHAMLIPASPFISKIRVGSGFDVADAKIVESIEEGDLVVTGDLPLADAVIDKGGTALNPNGELYTKENIKERLSIRNFHTELRNTGVQTGGPAGMSKKQIQRFANALDTLLRRAK